MCGKSKFDIEDVPQQDGIYEIEGIPMLQHHQRRQRIKSYKIARLSYGTLTQENLEQFLISRIKLLVWGQKDWGLELAGQVLNMVADIKEITYLFNFKRQTISAGSKKKCYRCLDPLQKLQMV